VPFLKKKARTRSSLRSGETRLRAVARGIIVAAFAVAFACGSVRSLRGGGYPNLIIILVDTLRADHLHYQGYHRRTSPRIDALAEVSQVFTHHHSTASRTGPSVASIFTGLYPRSHGVVNPFTEYDAKGTLADDQTTLAEILAARGFECSGFIANPNVSGHFGFAQGFETYEYLSSMAAPDINRKAVEKLKTRDNRPFFLYLHYMEPHSPYWAPETYRSLYADPQYHGPITGAHQQLQDIVLGRLVPDSSDVEEMKALYDQEIRYFDDEFGRLLDFLGDQGLRDNTIIVFVADHGEEFLDHGSAFHGYTLYEEQLRVPLFIYDPRIKHPHRIDAITRHVDILPTVLDLLGIDYDGLRQGRSLVPLIEAKEETGPPPPVFAETSLRSVRISQKRSFMVDGWKLIETIVPEEREELYHVASDPAERHDLIDDEQKVAADLRTRMRRFMEGLPVAKGGVVQLKQEEIERLRSLGYIE